MGAGVTAQDSIAAGETAQGVRLRTLPAELAETACESVHDALSRKRW